MVIPIPIVASIMNNPLTQEALVPAKDHIGYTVSFTKHRRNMHWIKEVLSEAIVGVKNTIKQYQICYLEIPSNAAGWLEDALKKKEEAENMPTVALSWFKFIPRHKIGRKAFRLSQEIENILNRGLKIKWDEYTIPPGRIGSMNASTSSAQSSDHHDEFPSREHIFKEALKALEPNHKSHMVALCGMSGVGKTKIMHRLKKIVQEKKMFDFWVEVVIGQKPDLVDIQNGVAYYLGIEIKVTPQLARIDMLCKRFESISKVGNAKFLIILDDVWERFDLNNIGLSHLPNQGVNFKVLLTSQDINVCNMMRVEASLTLTLSVKVLKEEEAQSLFRRLVGIFDDVDMELNKIVEDIVKKCCGLPRAIEKMADDLRDKRISTWNDTFSGLEQHDINRIAPTGFEKSLNNLEEETRSLFFLCGLFPRDIPIEELVRYGCGLKVFNGVCTIEKARNRLERHIEQLMHKNLLMESEDVSCVKMHGLMLSFVLNMLSKCEPASFVKYGSMPEWPADDMSIYERIISTCEGMTGFPRDLTFPKLSILKLMQGDKSLSFPSYFYKEMKELKVIAYDNMKRYPAIRGCSINLRVLHLHKCSLQKHDCSSIANLHNLEVLSFAKSTIQWLPSKIGNLKKLRLLDLTDCTSIGIDEGVFKSFENLEELYAIAGGEDRKAIRFTNDNLAELSKKLSALEFEFFGSNAHLENISFTKLKRFKISVGRSLSQVFHKRRHSYENTLQLVMVKCHLYDYGVNVLFEKTEVLCLSVAGMNDLENIDVKFVRPRQHSSFYNLKVLVVSECAELKYLFTLGVVKDLSKLEHLQVDKCNNLEELIHTNSSRTTLTFPKLKFLSLRQLPKLLNVCRNANKIELPQLVELQLSTLPNITNIYPVNNSETSCLLKEIGVPKLETLQIEHLENLKEIWPREFTTCDKVALRLIQVGDCGNLVNLFPCNPMPLLCHLEELQVEKCGSIEMLFNIDLDCVGQIEERHNNSSLRNIHVKELGNLTEVWRIKGLNNYGGLIRGFEAVETITISECTRFGNVSEPTTINFDMGAVVRIINRGSSGSHFELVESRQTKEGSWRHSREHGVHDYDDIIYDDINDGEEFKKHATENEEEEKEDLNLVDRPHDYDDIDDGEGFEKHTTENKKEEDLKLVKPPYKEGKQRNRKGPSSNTLPSVLILDRYVPYDLQNGGTNMITHPNCFHRLSSYPFNNEFWPTLYGQMNDGWLESAHFEIWVRLLMETRTESDRWTIMPSNFFKHPGEQPDWTKHGAGVTKFPEMSAPWWTVDTVYMPIHAGRSHWLLGVLSLDTFKVHLYDSLTTFRQFDDLNSTLSLKLFQSRLQTMLEGIDYWKMKNVPHRQLKLQYIKVKDVPQQAPTSSDCGVFVCMFLEKMLSGQSLDLDTDALTTARNFRLRMAQIIWATHA